MKKETDKIPNDSTFGIQSDLDEKTTMLMKTHLLRKEETDLHHRYCCTDNKSEIEQIHGNRD